MLAIVGSRNFYRYDLFTRAVLKVLTEWNLQIKDICIISGGAIGADSLAEKFALDYDIPIQVYKPEYNLYGKYAPLRRNTTIVDKCTHS